MLTAVADKTVFLGLTSKDVERLKSEKLILLDAEKLGVKNDFVLFFEETDSDLLHTLKSTGIQLPDVIRIKGRIKE